MSNFEFLKSSDSNARMNAIEIVLGSLLASLSHEQLDKVQDITQLTLKKMTEDQLLSPGNHLKALEVSELVQFLFTHLPDRVS
ncbi:hypothetical protein RM407_001536 [Enterobacter kobei]|nr:hypothetical protein [Enterobacter kobei]